jgi:D-aminoacyl-tRNA deacylase
METFFLEQLHLTYGRVAMILVVASEKDAASINIKKQLLTNYRFNETTARFQENTIYAGQVNGKDIQLITLNQESIYAQSLTTHFIDPELIVFISRHSSMSGTPTLSVHTPGNLGSAGMGGKPREVSVSPSNAMREALKVMSKMRDEMRLKYEVSYEGTHHGPSLNTPTMFAELGSSPVQWNDAAAAEVVAHAAMGAISRFRSASAETVLGMGGPHYNSKFTKMALQTEVAFGHIIPKHSIQQIDLGILQQCVDRTLEKVERAVLDWKGIKGDDKPRALEMLNKIGLRIQKV